VCRSPKVIQANSSKRVFEGPDVTRSWSLQPQPAFRQEAKAASFAASERHNLRQTVTAVGSAALSTGSMQHIQRAHGSCCRRKFISQVPERQTILEFGHFFASVQQCASGIERARSLHLYMRLSRLEWW
jgi:hypothetical protein